MSDSGEVEVEAVQTYQVLPKDVTDELGSIKLFNKWSYEDVEIRDISLTYGHPFANPGQKKEFRDCGMLRVVGDIQSFKREKNTLILIFSFKQRLHSNPLPRLHLPLCWKVRRQALPQGTMPDRRASHQLAHDERTQQRKEAHGCAHCRTRFRDC